MRATNHWFLLKIIPYRTIENAVKGVVITFIDITDVKSAQTALEREREFLIKVLENSPTGKTMVDSKGLITFANKKAEEILGLTKEEIITRNYNDKTWKHYNLDGSEMRDDQMPFSIVMKTKKQIKGMKFNIHRIQDDKKLLLLINGSPMLDDNNNVVGAVFSMLEIDE